MIAYPQTFKKAERLCSRKIITGLFGSGKIFYTPYFRVLWAKTDLNPGYPAQIAFMVPKKVFRHAVKRNLLKRRMREAYRKNKNLLYDFLDSQNINIALIVIYRKDKQSDFGHIETGIREMLEKLRSEIITVSR